MLARPLPAPERAETLARLRAELGCTPLSAPSGLPIGIPELDSASGPWASPGISEICGAPGSGRLSIILPTLARETAAGRWVAIVDVLSRLHPPGLDGVRLSRLLVLRPGAERAIWATEQLLRSAAIPFVLLLDCWNTGVAGHRLLHAAEEGRSALVITGDRPDTRLPAALRLETRRAQEAGGIRVRITRRRAGREGVEVLVPG